MSSDKRPAIVKLHDEIDVILEKASGTMLSTSEVAGIFQCLMIVMMGIGEPKIDLVGNARGLYYDILNVCKNSKVPKIEIVGVLKIISLEDLLPLMVPPKDEPDTEIEDDGPFPDFF